MTLEQFKQLTTEQRIAAHITNCPAITNPELWVSELSRAATSDRADLQRAVRVVSGWFCQQPVSASALTAALSNIDPRLKFCATWDALLSLQPIVDEHDALFVDNVIASVQAKQRLPGEKIAGVEALLKKYHPNPDEFQFDDSLQEPEL